MFSDLLQDFRYGFRQLIKARGFTIVAILTLAIGIGTTTAIFSIVNSVALQPMPYADAEQLLEIRQVRKADQRTFSPLWETIEELQKQTEIFSSVTASTGMHGNLSGVDFPVRVFGHAVALNYFSTLGVQPLIGRTFLPEEVIEGNGNVVILNHTFWLSQFNGRKSVLEEKILLNDEPYTIVGVMPPGFSKITGEMSSPKAFSPLVANNVVDSMRFMRECIGRLKPGATLEQAQAELDVFAKRMEASDPEQWRDFSLRVEPLRDYHVGDAKPTLYLAVIGGAIGILFAFWSMNALLTFAPVNMPRLNEVHIDGFALFISCAVTMLTGIGFGLVPALQATKVDLTLAMKEGGRSSGDGQQRARLRNTLVVVEVALALVLLIGAGLLTRTFANLQNVDLGYDGDTVHLTRLMMLDAKYPDDAARITFTDRALEQLAQKPEIVAAAFSTSAPYFGFIDGSLDIEAQTEADISRLPQVALSTITPDYFKVMNTPLRSGRVFNERDRANTPLVAIIGENVAQQHFPDKNPIGQRIAFVRGDGPREWREIIGVVGNIHLRGAVQEAEPGIYVPWSQFRTFSPKILVKVRPGRPQSRTDCRHCPPKRGCRHASANLNAQPKRFRRTHDRTSALHPFPFRNILRVRAIVGRTRNLRRDVL